MSSNQEVLEDAGTAAPSSSSYECCIAVEGIPIVEEEDFETNKSKLMKLFSMPHRPVSTLFPTDYIMTDKTKPYCFIQYKTPTAASIAADLLNKCEFDSKHTLAVSTIVSIRNEIRELKKKKDKDHIFGKDDDLWWWLDNPSCSNQFATQSEGPDGTTLDVYRHSDGDEPCLVNTEASRLNWSETIFKWSPYGTYLVTIHSIGIALWGGEKFAKLQEMEHVGVTHVDFSPCETYVITFAYETNRIRIFDVLTGETKMLITPGSDAATVISQWPIIKWSSDEKYFAYYHVLDSIMFLYNGETFKQYNWISLPGMSSFEWNPTKNVIGYYCMVQNLSSPAEIGIIEYPFKEKRSHQRIFSVSSASLYWQKNGDYLAAYTERFTNGFDDENHKSDHLDIFDFTAKDATVQSFQIPGKFISFEFEPHGNKFAVLIRSGYENKVTPLIYRIDPKEPLPKPISALDDIGYQLSSVKWAPQGGWLVVHSADTYAGQAIFIDATSDEVTPVQTIWHRGMNYGEWDPTGRFFITASAGNQKYKSGYFIHTFNGQKVYEKNTEGFLSLQWRPRPPCLTDEMEMNLVPMAIKFEEKRYGRNKAFKELIENRCREMTDVIEEKLEKRQSLLEELRRFTRAAIERR